MQRARPPTIPASVNCDSSYSRTLQVSSLQVNGSVTGSITVPTLTVQDEVSFFGSDLTSQRTVYPTINSIILALQHYGLAAPGYTQEGNRLLGTGSVGDSRQGNSVSLSVDGNTLAIGGERDNSRVGATWIFIKTAGVWEQQGDKLIGTGAIGTAQQGYSVSLSADGNTLAVGGPVDNDIGAVWIFTRTGGVWSQQGSKLVGTGYIDFPEQGTAVALSADGNTLAIGGPYDNNSIGATWIFTRTDGVWSQQGSKIVGTGYIDSPEQGTSVSLSADGNTLASGGYYDDSSIGATWIFTRTDGVWSQQGSKLVGSGGIGEQRQGYSVALRGDTLVVGGYTDNSNIGATWVFHRSGSTWTQVGEKLIGTGAVGNASQGTSVSLSDNESILITSGYADNSNIGAVWVFKLVDSVWTQYNQKLVPTGYTGTPRFGSYSTSIFISGDGSTLAIGGPYEPGTWIYVGF